MGYFIESNLDFVGNSEDLARAATIAAQGLFLPGDHDKINERLIRYYVTEGLVTRPKRIGRDAEYGYLQLLQFLASRFLVEQGYPLAKVAPYIQALENKQLEDLVVQQHKPNLAELLVAAYQTPSLKLRQSRLSDEKKISPPKRSLKDFLDDEENAETLIQHQKKFFISENQGQKEKSLREVNAFNLTTLEVSIQEINKKMFQLKEQLYRQQKESQLEMRHLQQAIDQIQYSISQVLETSNQRLLNFMMEFKKNEQRQAQEISLLAEKIKLIEQNSLQKNTQRSAGDDK